jgi:ankyrin repeat protein
VKVVKERVRTTVWTWDDELLSAALHGDLIKVRTALENGANPNAIDSYGSTPLHYAASWIDAGVVKILLEHGADPWIADNGGHIPLDYAKYRAIRSLLESTMRNS